MDPSTVTTIATLAGVLSAVLTKLADLLLTRWKERRGEHIDDRKLLSEDEREFRRSIMDEVKRLSADLVECNKQHVSAQFRIVELESKVRQLERAA